VLAPDHNPVLNGGPQIVIGGEPALLSQRAPWAQEG
jgi:hypothetical protein